MKNYKGWNIEFTFNRVRISGRFGTSGTFNTEADAIAWIDARFP